MAQLIGGTVTATATATSLYDLLVTATLIDPDLKDPTFVRALTIHNVSGADLTIGDANLGVSAAHVMATVATTGWYSVSTEVYHVDLKAIYVKGSGSIEILGIA